MHVDAIGPFLPPFGTTPGPGSSPGATVEYLRDLVQKRIVTLIIRGTYMMAASRSHWFHTIKVSRVELDRVFDNTAMKKRERRKRPAKCLWKHQQKRKTGVGDYTLGVSDTSDTYLAIQHMPFPQLYPDSALASGHVLRQAPRALALSARVATYARPSHPPRRLPLP
ncbi:hypothetical protein BGW80DRAFT_576312 [Lactifluus volemus]|nr:hypothetical protein BGW80DRAFT_576312 [Lactifluus volemus]